MKAIRIISWTTGLLVLFLGISAFVLSFDAIRGLAEANGTNIRLSWLFPLVVDGAIIAFSLSVMRSSLYGEPNRIGWVLVGLFTVTSIAYNIAHARTGGLSYVLAATPPIALFLSFETLMGQLQSEVRRSQTILTLSDIQGQILDKQTEMSDILGDLSGQVETLQGQLSDLSDKREAIKSELSELRKEKRDIVLRPSAEPQTPQDKLSTRRESVLNLSGQGRTPADIARELSVSEKTIQRDLKSLNGKVKKEVTQ